MIIYYAMNITNGMGYVGQTRKGLACRKQGHLAAARRGSVQPFHCAIRDFGVENFTWEVIDTAGDIDDLNEKEKYYIELYRCKDRGYNAMSGGSNTIHSHDTKRKISVANKGKVRSVGTRARISAARKGRRHTLEARAKMSAARKGKKSNNFGKSPSAESKKKRSEAQRGKKHTDEAKSKMGRKGYSHHHFDPKIYPFFHIEHGIIGCTQHALYTKFLLKQGKVSDVARGTKVSYKGWRMAANMN